jgi:hypothetical protein
MMGKYRRLMLLELYVVFLAEVGDFRVVRDG